MRALNRYEYAPVAVSLDRSRPITWAPSLMAVEIGVVRTEAADPARVSANDAGLFHALRARLRSSLAKSFNSVWRIAKLTSCSSSDIRDNSNANLRAWSMYRLCALRFCLRKSSTSSKGTAAKSTVTVLRSNSITFPMEGLVSSSLWQNCLLAALAECANESVS